MPFHWPCRRSSPQTRACLITQHTLSLLVFFFLRSASRDKVMLVWNRAGGVPLSTITAFEVRSRAQQTRADGRGGENSFPSLPVRSPSRRPATLNLCYFHVPRFSKAL
jgi:hypothetical protein